MEPIMFWLILLIMLIGIEIATTSLTTIWFAGGSLVAILAAALNAPVAIQIILFFLVSLILLFFTRPVAVKYFNKDRVRTNVESLVGRQAIVISEINNLQSIGQVTVGGQEWSARSFEEKGKIPVGAVVRIMAISGVKLIVGEIPVEEQPAAPASVVEASSEERRSEKPEEEGSRTEDGTEAVTVGGAVTEAVSPDQSGRPEAN